MKKLTSILLTAAITLSLLPVTVFAATFNDVSSKHWAYDYIEEMADRNVLSGYPNGSFYPENQVTRAEFAKIMVTAAGLKLSSQNSTQYFEDVSNKHWSFPYVTSAMTYLTGYSSPYGNYYYPDKPALREDIAVALVKLKGYDTYGADESILNTMFTDASSISGDAKKYVATALERGLISGYEDNTFRGQKSITRAEAAALLWRAYQYGNDNKVTGDEIVENFTTPEPTKEPTPETTEEPTPKPTNKTKPTKESETTPVMNQDSNSSDNTAKSNYIIRDAGGWTGDVNTFNRVTHDYKNNVMYVLGTNRILRQDIANVKDETEVINLNKSAYVPNTGEFTMDSDQLDSDDNYYTNFRVVNIFFDNYRNRIYVDMYSSTMTDFGALNPYYETDIIDITLYFDASTYDYDGVFINALGSDEVITSSYEDGIIAMSGNGFLRLLNADTLKSNNTISCKNLVYGLDVKIVNGQIRGMRQTRDYSLLQKNVTFTNYDFTDWNDKRAVLSVFDNSPIAYSSNDNYFYVLDSEGERIIRCDMKGNLSILVDFNEVDINITDMRDFEFEWKGHFIVSDDESTIIFFQKDSNGDTIGRQIVKIS